MSDEFDAPKSDDDTMNIDDLEVPKPTWKTWVPSAFLFVAGTLTTAAGLQVGLFFGFYSWIAGLIPWVLFACGIAVILSSVMLSRGRDWG